jgi:hypothetical protein
LWIDHARAHDIVLSHRLNVGGRDWHEDAGRGRSPAETAASALRNAEPIALAELEAVMRAELFDSPEMRPPLAMVEARLELALDVRRELELLIATVTPLAKTERTLADAIRHAEEMCSAPLEAIPAIAQDVCDRLREAWRAANTTLPSDFLASTVERALLTERAYQRRYLLGGSWLRAHCHDNSATQAAYLPECVACLLPLSRELSVRAIVDVLPPQDSADGTAVCLRVVALARSV